MLSPAGTVVSPLPEQSAPPSSSQLHEGEQTAAVCPWPAAPGRRKHHKHIQNKSTRIFSSSVQAKALNNREGKVEGRSVCGLIYSGRRLLMWSLRLRHGEMKPIRRFSAQNTACKRFIRSKTPSAELKTRLWLRGGPIYLAAKHFSTPVCVV